ncbi:alkaline phosphatase family protein [Microbacterium sp. P02]|uniref:alkaline phosphatase family protein n=1 Tax=Microbacterium sp. P02 TaxID=3366260 RepID=UPI00366BAF06
MTPSLPAEPPRARSLTEVLPQLLASLSASSEWFAPADSAVVFVVDGLGARNLAGRAGHARFLAPLSTKKDVARTVFPSTTAAALTSLLTGEWPGEHGIVGYRARVPGTDDVPNQLKGWETDGLSPTTWQRCTPIMEREAARGRPCFVVSRAEYLGSGFTEATLRGATFRVADDLIERVELAADAAAQHPGALVYLYAPELDSAGHRFGWESDEWGTTLELVDRAALALQASLPRGVGAVLTADHGMVDVPRHRQVLLSEGDALLEGVRLIGGEPRMLHLYAEAGEASRVQDRWTAAESGRSWVFSRDEAIARGLFGRHVAEPVLGRIGDVMVAARAQVAYYDDRLLDKGSQRMIGQHGSLTDEERSVPMLRLGAYA